MIDLVMWSFAVAVLPMVLAVGGSMIAGAAGVLGRPPARPQTWTQTDRLRFRPTTPPAFGHARLSRFEGRYYDL